MSRVKETCATMTTTQRNAMLSQCRVAQDDATRQILHYFLGMNEALFQKL